MKLFLDSANLEEIEECLQLGFISGITTNPSLISKEPKGDFLEHIGKILELCVKGNKDIPVSVEIFANGLDESFDQIKFLIDSFGKEKRVGLGQLVIKIPVSWRGLELIRACNGLGAPVNCTCCFTEAQCILAANAGARYVSLFAARMMDQELNAFQIIKEVRTLLDSSKSSCEIIAGSVRIPDMIPLLLNSGAHIVTAGMKHLKAMAEHPGTTASVEGFTRDFKEWSRE